MSLPSFFSRHLHFLIARLVTVTLVALAWSSPAFCDKIHDAARDGDLTKVKALIKDNPNLVFSRDNDGNTPLHYAAGFGHKDVTELLLAQKAVVDAKDNDGWTPLHFATLQGHEEIAELLLAHKADVNVKNTDGDTPLHMAGGEGYKELVELLLAHKAVVDAKNNDGMTPLHIAAANGHKDVVELLHRHGGHDSGSSEEVPTTTDTTIHNAAPGGNLAILQALVKHMPYMVSTKDNYGRTPLHLAAEGGRKEDAEFWLANKAEVDARDNQGETPLDRAVFGGHKDMVELLLAHGASVNAKANNGSTPLNTAVYMGFHDRAYKNKVYRDLAELLLAHGADVNGNTKGGWTPLHGAAFNDDKDMVELLLAHKADVDAKDNSGEAPLHVAARYGYRDVVQLLLANSAEINAKNNKGETPLHRAAKEGHEDVVELLRQHGGQEASGSEISVQEAVGRWVSAFRSKDSNAMADCYAPLVEKYFRRDNVSHEQIRMYIHSAFQRMVDIRKYEVSDIHIELAPVGNPTSGISAGRATAAFRKTWDTVNSDSNSFSGEEIEQLTFTSLPEGWKIIREEELKIIRTSRQTATPLQSPARKDALTLTREIHDAARDGDLEKVKALLKDRPEMVFSKDKDGRTPLHWAAKKGHKDIVELLLASKAQVDAKDEYDYTPLHEAALEGHKVVAELLLAKHAEVNAKDYIGATPLFSAAANGHKDVVELLLANKADVNAKDHKGGTPLHLAVWFHRKDMVELLLARGADVNATAGRAGTPLDVATENDSKDIAELLQSAVATTKPASAGSSQPAAASPSSPLPMKQYSYPNVGFRIAFPASWAVREQSVMQGEWEYRVEGTASADIPRPSELIEKKPDLSKAERLAADVAFLKGVRVWIFVRKIENEELFGLTDGVNNRISGMAIMEGKNVDILPVEKIPFAGVSAYFTRYTERHDKGAFGVVTTSTTDYDFDHGPYRYVLSLQSPTEELSKHAQEFEDIVRSFELTGSSSLGELDITGKWMGTSPGPCPDNPTVICDDGFLWVFSFIQSGEKLSGTSSGISRYLLKRKSPPTTVELDDGKVQGNHVSFAWHYLGGSRCSSEGTIDMDENRITLTYGSCSGTPEANGRAFTITRFSRQPDS